MPSSLADDLAAAADALAAVSERAQRQLLAAARARRRRRVEMALREVRRDLLRGMPARAAARAIADAARGRRASASREVKRRLVEELGDLGDLPEAERIRQLLGE